MVDAGEVEVATVRGPVEAAVVQGLLRAYGIPARVVAAIPHALWPFNVDGPGAARVLVGVEHADAVREILAGHLRAGLVAVEGDATATGRT